MGLAAPDFAELVRRQSEEWHDQCATCGGRYQGRGLRCSSCDSALRERKDAETHRREMLDATRTASSMLPPWGHWAIFEKLETHPTIDRALYEVAKSWKRRAGNLLLLGPTGIGKTAVAHAIGWRILMTAVNARTLEPEDRRFAGGLRWYTASSLALARKQSRLGAGEAAAISDACDASLLMLDELGYEPTCDCTLFDVIDARYVQGAPTILTSGRREHEIAERYGDAFMRRLRELGKVVDVHPKT